MQNKTMGFVAGCIFAIGIAMNLQVVTAGVEDNVGWDYLTKRVASVESSLATLLTKNNSNSSEIASLNKVTAPDTAKMKADLDKKNAKLNEMLLASETISDTNSTLVAWAKANGVEKALEDPPAKLTTGIGNTFSVKYEGTTYWYMTLNDAGTRCVYMGTGSSPGANKDAGVRDGGWDSTLSCVTDTTLKSYLALASRFNVATPSTSAATSAIMTYTERSNLGVDRWSWVTGVIGCAAWINDLDGSGTTYRVYSGYDDYGHYFTNAPEFCPSEMSSSAGRYVPAYTISEK